MRQGSQGRILHHIRIRKKQPREEAARRGYCIILEYELNKKPPSKDARQPGEEIASYLNGNSIRLKPPQEEARDPREEIASYLNKNSIRHDHRIRQGSQERILHYI